MTWGAGTGGDEVFDLTDGEGVTWRYHAFKTVGSDTFTVTAAGNFEHLIVAGGAGGGRGANTTTSPGISGGGGGGAGGALIGTVNLEPDSFTVVVGAGGAGATATSAKGVSGGNSSVFSLTALGGGGAGSYTTSLSAGAASGVSGGSGGGAGRGGTNFSGSGTAGQGFDGGNGTGGNNGNVQQGGGGGGADDFGGWANYKAGGGDGGNGIEWPRGSGNYYAGGGGGAGSAADSFAGRFGAGGLGGGGRSFSDGVPPVAGAANTGGGGGGGSSAAAAGGSGIVIIRYAIVGGPVTPDPRFVRARGGQVFDEEENGVTWRYHKFTRHANNTFIVENAPEDTTVEVLVVGGGGGGAKRRFGGGGGGGAGGFVAGTETLVPGTYTAFVGLGGRGGTNNVGAPAPAGTNSSIFSFDAVGGGGGGAPGQALGSGDGGSGGSGGGAGRGSRSPGSGTINQGNNGGLGDGTGSVVAASRGGGGGGATQVGENSITTAGLSRGGNGGDGAEWPSGSDEYYAGGGGAGGQTSDISAGRTAVGGLGGGGDAETATEGPQDGAPNTGGGGGAGGTVGGNGANGVVIVRYIVPDLDPVPATVTTGTATEITKTSAKLSGTLVDDGGETATFGIAVGLAADSDTVFFISDPLGTEPGTYDVTVDGLTAGTTYFFQAFALSTAGPAFGDWEQFTTDAGAPPTVFNAGVNFGGTAAEFAGLVTDEGESIVTDRGIVYGPLPNPVIGQEDVVKLESGSGPGGFTVNVTGLDPETTYNWRAYATNLTAGTSYADSESFTTLVAQPPAGLDFDIPTVPEDTIFMLGSLSFDTDPEQTFAYTWQMSPQTSEPFTPGTTITVIVDGNEAATVELIGQDNVAKTAALLIQPRPNWFGTATFSFRVSNGFEFSDWAQATFTVTPVPDPPGAVVGNFPNFDEDDTAQFDLTWPDVDDLPAGTLVAADGYFIQMRPTAGGAWRWLTEGSPTARLTNVVVRILNYSTTELRATMRVEPDANYNGPYGAQVRVAKQLEDGSYLFGPSRNLSATIASVPDAPTRPQPNRMPTAKVGQTVLGTFTTFDPDLEDTSWTFEISAPGAGVYGTSLVIPGVGSLAVVDEDLTDQRAQVRLNQTDKFVGPLTYALWNFNSNSLTATVSLGATGTSIVNGSLSALTTGDLGYLTAPALITNPASGATDATTAISANSYFEFTATLPPGINWTSLTFKAARGGASTPRGYAVRTSADGYATTLKTEDIPTQRTTFTDFEVPLAGLPTSAPVTFRIYVYSPGTFASVEFDDITITGTVAAELPRYEFDLRVTDSSGLVSPTQRVIGLITLPTATVFLQKVTRNSPAVITPLTPLVEVFQLNVTDSLDGVGGADVTVSTDEVRRRAAQLGITAAELLEPGTVELVVAIGTQIVFTGPVGEVEWSAIADRITITARGLLAYLEERRIGTGTTSFVGEDISDIMFTLIDDAQQQTAGDYSFTDNSTAAGTNLTVEFERRTRILEALRNLSRADGAPDFWIDPERRFNAEQARGQDRRNLIRITPGMMENATWTNRDEQLATVVTVIGGEDGMGGFFEATAVTTDTAALARYGRRELLLDRPELTSNQQCQDYAARVVEEQARRSETIRADIIVTPNRPFSIRDLEVGDIVTVDLRAPDLGQVIGAYRIVNRRLNLVSETADSYRVRLDLVPAPFVNSALVKVKARHNASIVERLAQESQQQ